MRRGVIVLLSSLGLFVVVHAEAPTEAERQQARAILARWPVLDGHNDAPWEIRDRFKNKLDAFDFRNTTQGERPMHTDLTRAKAGGLRAQFWSVYVPTSFRGADATKAVLEQIDLVKRLAARYPDEMAMAYTRADIASAWKQGKLASLIGIEGGYAIADSLAVLRMLYDAGARYMTLAHWETMSWVDAATDDPKHQGLSKFGEIVIKEMNRLGMLIDLSHVSAETMNDTLDLSASPVIFSHSSARAISGHARNVPDEVLQRLPNNGGVVMVNYAPVFVSERVRLHHALRDAEEARLKALHLGFPDRWKAELEAWDTQHPAPDCTLGELVDHIDHIRKIAGIDHVGIGSDLDGIWKTPVGLEDVSKYVELVVELKRRHYADEQIGKITSGNILRVLERAEQVAARLQATSHPFEFSIEELDRPDAK
jgi:membrane dipeptidase